MNYPKADINKIMDRTSKTAMSIIFIRFLNFVHFSKCTNKYPALLKLSHYLYFLYEYNAKTILTGDIDQVYIRHNF